jgi:hypothetical protein
VTGTYQVDRNGHYWFIPDPEEVRMEPYQRRRQEDLSWVGDWNIHLSQPPQRELNDDEYAAILSVLNGQTREEWEAQRLAEGKPISPIGEEKED